MKVLFYPDPLRKVAISMNEMMCQRMGWEITRDIDSDWDFGIYWDFNDVNKTPENLLSDKRLVFNRLCNDVTKSKVDEVFKSVFGYSSEVDTTKHGFCVKKNIGQYRKDFTIVQTPCEKQSGYIYQKFFNSRMAIDWSREYRIFLCQDKHMMVIREKNMAGAFIPSLGESRGIVDDVYNHFTKDEVDKILEVCRRLGFDLGGVDIIRDYSDGRVYVIDINNICGFARPVTNLAIEPLENFILKTAIDSLI